MADIEVFWDFGRGKVIRRDTNRVLSASTEVPDDFEDTVRDAGDVGLWVRLERSTKRHGWMQITILEGQNDDPLLSRDGLDTRNLPQDKAPEPVNGVKSTERGAFRNPYAFIPKAKRHNNTNSDLQEGDGPSLGVLHDERVTGSLYVELEVETPLLIADGSRSVVDELTGHMTIRTTTKRDGETPHIPGSSSTLR